MNNTELIIKMNKPVKITGVKGNILSPLGWIKKVQGIDYLKYLNSYGLTLGKATQLMEWYADYVGRKIKKYCH